MMPTVSCADLNWEGAPPVPNWVGIAPRWPAWQERLVL